MKTNSGLYINTRISTENKLFRNGERVNIPTIIELDAEEKKNIKTMKTWRDVKDLILYKMQRGELIYCKPMTDRELNQFSKIVFEYFESLEK